MTWLAGRGWGVDVVDLMPLGHWIPPDLAAQCGAEYVQHDICTGAVPRLGAGAYDLLLMGQVLGHVKWRPDGALWNVSRLLKPGGVALVHVLDRERTPIESATLDWRDLPVYPDGEPTEMMNSTQYDRASFAALLATAFCGVHLWDDDGGSVIFGECRAPREYRPGTPGPCVESAWPGGVG